MPTTREVPAEDSLVVVGGKIRPPKTLSGRTTVLFPVS